MDSRKVIGDCGESSHVDQETHVDQVGASASETALLSEARSEKLAPYQDRSGVSDNCIKTAQHGSESGQFRSFTLDEIIKQTLIRVLHETKGNRRRTAIMLGISRSTLYRMLERYGIDSVGRETRSRKPRTDRMDSGPAV
jgi:transcriptional regulator of acetoin/glycerol metabolism